MPVLAGKVSVFVPATAGAEMVIAPEVSPATIMELIKSPILSH